MTQTIRVADIVLDPRLQCRAELNRAVVDEYTLAIREQEVEFPPLEIVRVPELGLLLVDGWHRHAAYVAAGKRRVPATVTEGDFRSALLAAVRANGHHGLRRSTADKRRAVRILLADREWCALPSRELAQLAGVSHTYVNQVRAHYGVGPGAVLTPEHQAQVDGEVPPVWKELLGATRYYKSTVEQLRVAVDPLELAKLWPVGSGAELLPAARQRAAELATEPWPWPADVDAELKAARAAALDEVATLAWAVTAQECPDRDRLYEVLRWRLVLPELLHEYLMVDLPAVFAGRPRLLDDLAGRRAAAAEAKREREAAEAAKPLKDPWDFVRAIRNAPDAPEQERLLRAAPAETLSYLGPHELRPAVRDGEYRRRRGDAGPCRIPGCGGWVLGSNAETGTCAWCRQTYVGWSRSVTQGARAIEEALRREGVAIRLGAHVVDARDLELLARILDAARVDISSVRQWLLRGPDVVVAYAEDWMDAPVPTTVLEDPSAPAPPAPVAAPVLAEAV